MSEFLFVQVVLSTSEHWQWRGTHDLIVSWTTGPKAQARFRVKWGRTGLGWRNSRNWMVVKTHFRVVFFSEFPICTKLETRTGLITRPSGPDLNFWFQPKSTDLGPFPPLCFNPLTKVIRNRPHTGSGDTSNNHRLDSFCVSTCG